MEFKDRLPLNECAKYLRGQDEKINKELLDCMKNNTLPYIPDFLKEKSGLIKETGKQKEINIGMMQFLKIYLNMGKRHSDYSKEKLLYTPKQLETVEKIENESGNKVQCIIDKEFVAGFKKIMGVSYRGGAVNGKYVIVGDPKTLEDETFLRHEAIHAAQQREMGFISWTVSSFLDLLKKKNSGEIKGLDESIDFGTDNQWSDYETYINQFTPGYLKTRPAFAHERYKDPIFRKQEYNRLTQEEYSLLEEKYKESLLSGDTSLILKYRQDLQSFGRMLSVIKDENEVNVVMIRQDLPYNKSEDTKFQVKTETQTAREKRLTMEKYIQQHGTKEENYQDGVVAYLKKREEDNKKQGM